MTHSVNLFLLVILLISQFSASAEVLSDKDPIVAEILSETDQTRWMDWIGALSGAEPVHTSTGDGKILSRSSYALFEPDHVPSAFIYLQDELHGLGFKKDVDFEVHTYDFPYSERYWERNWKNLILTFPGSGSDSEQQRVLLVAHLDSTSDQETTLAPGADDNASGAAGLLEAASVLRHYQFEHTIHLVWFSGEEQSRRGSEYFVQDYAAWLPEILGVVNLDMFAFDWDNDRCFEVHAGMLAGSQQIGNDIADAIDSYDLNLTFDFLDDERAYRFSDHEPFWDLGVPAVMVFENGFYQEGKTCGNADRNYSYHTTADTLTYINADTGFSILQAAIAVTSHMAGPIAPCFTEPPRPKTYTDLQRIYIHWDSVPSADAYQLWIVNNTVRNFVGQTTGTNWVLPIQENSRTWRYEVVALSQTRCQSLPGIFPHK